jgi:hypothetical protein
MGVPQVPFTADIMDMSHAAAPAASSVVSNMAALTSTAAAAMGMDMGPGACKISVRFALDCAGWSQEEEIKEDSC